MDIGHDELLAYYQAMRLTRALDDHGRLLAAQGKVRGTPQAVRGYEAVAVGAASALRDRDLLAPIYAGLGARLVRGVTPRTIIAGWLARGTERSAGRDDVAHRGDLRSHGILPIAHDSGASIALAVGAALATRLRAEPRVVLALINETTLLRGQCHEALALAAARVLPLLCVIEQRTYSEDADHRQGSDLARYAAAYGISLTYVEGNDILEVRNCTAEMLRAVHAGHGPQIIAARVPGSPANDHYSNDASDGITYDAWRQRDPIERFAHFLQEQGILTTATRLDLERAIAQVVDDAITFAETLPDADPATLLTDLYASPDAITAQPLDAYAVAVVGATKVEHSG